MRFGVVFPQTEIGNDPIAIRDFAQAAEGLGYNHILAFDHVLGTPPAAGKPTPYTHEAPFHEPFVLFGFLAGQTQAIGLATGVVILPQRQTALVAKQAAAVDVLSKGRLRLGIGVGWNPPEYEALGMNWHDRGKRCEEQIEVMRRLWTEELVTFKGRWHTVNNAGINPLPVQRPIPVWFGGNSDRVVERVGRMGDGWIPFLSPDDKGRALLERMRGHARDAGRDPAQIGIECMMEPRDSTPEDWLRDIEAYRAMGVSYISIRTMRAGYTTTDQQVQAIRRFMDVARDAIR